MSNFNLNEGVSGYDGLSSGSGVSSYSGVSGILGTISNIDLTIFSLNSDDTITLSSDITFSRASTGSTTSYDGTAITGLSNNIPRIKGARYIGDTAYWKLVDGSYLHPIVSIGGTNRFAVIDAWVSGTDYQVNDTVIPTGNTNPSGAGGNGWAYQLVTRAAVAPGTEPTWGTTVGADTTDASGNVWRNISLYRIDGQEIATGEAFTLPTSKFNDTQGIVVCDIKYANWATPTGYILGGASGYPLKAIATNAGEAHDGVNTVQGPASSPAGMMRIATEYGGAVMSVAVNGSAGAQDDYDGSFNLANPIPAFSGVDAAVVRNLMLVKAGGSVSGVLKTSD